MMSEKSNISNFLNRYIIRYIPALCIAGFIVWHLFLAPNNYFDICRNDEKIRELEKAIKHEEMLIQQLQEEINNTESDAVTINRIAREKHGMQQAHEDVYIVVTEPGEQQTTTPEKQ